MYAQLPLKTISAATNEVMTTVTEDIGSPFNTNPAVYYFFKGFVFVTNAVGYFIGSVLHFFVKK